MKYDNISGPTRFNSLWWNRAHSNGFYLISQISLNLKKYLK